MSVRLFVGYFLALAACATAAFSSPGAGQSVPVEAGMVPPSAYYDSSATEASYRASFAHSPSRRTPMKRSQASEGG